MQDIMLFIVHHRILSLSLVSVVILLIILEFIKLKSSATRLTPAEVTELLNHQNAVIVDIRSAAQFKEGHIVGSLSLPMAELEQKVKKLEKFKSQPMIIVCASGLESPRAAVLLGKQGFNIRILGSGMRAWREAAMPLVKEQK